ncbi:MAG: AMP-binding protein [Pseudomonadota bacterium]|nr:AMP-binding protein [Pseudomonadota bacterium]
MATATNTVQTTGEHRSLTTQLDRAAERFPDHPALIDATQSLTWAAARAAVAKGHPDSDAPVAQAIAILSDLARGEVFYFTETQGPLPPRTDMVFGATRSDGSTDPICHASADAAHLGAALALREKISHDDRVALATPVSDPAFWSILAACMASGAALDLSGDLSQATTGWITDADAVARYTPQPHLKRLHLRAPRDRLAEVSAAQPDTRLVNGLSLPETFGLVLSSDPRDPVGTITTTNGRPVGGVEVMIVDPRTGMDVLLYQSGEVWLRGTGIFLGYAGRPGAGFTDRFFRTGILGHLDSEGRLVLSRAEEEVLLNGW